MEVKTFEVRDDGTLIPVIATKLGARDHRDHWLLMKGGFGADAETMAEYVLVYSPIREEIHYAPGDWQCGRTMKIAHKHIEDNWDMLPNGEVVCVETILGERDEPKATEESHQYKEEADEDLSAAT